MVVGFGCACWGYQFGSRGITYVEGVTALSAKHTE